ncbi:Protein LURP-one-related 17 [Striga hermonthica]|uniref:Protein LURP-one-related 17 n=1 Tax=Striga hermonthica TaxID=68872 RepID=A0A9N7MRI6_STRHE|nr:Protein LURP-one-related 17 [Striga hermonthica]
MFFFTKPRSSRTVHHYHDEDQKESNKCINIQENCVSFTVWRKSLVFSCKGFTVIGSDGSLVYRVDNYTGRPDRIVLMDGPGHPIFTISRRKKLGIAENFWLVYEGEVEEKSNKTSKEPIFCVRKNNSIMKSSKPSLLACVYRGSCEKRCVYTIEGSYENRSCKILDESKRVVSEIKKKEAITNGGGAFTFGLEVFDLIVRIGVDSTFAMALVLLLDQMFT